MSNDRPLPRVSTLVALAVLLIALLLRFYHVTSPYVDLSSWRSLDYAAMARNFHELDNRLWMPRVDWAGPTGLVETEFPILPWLVAQAYPLVGERAWLGRVLCTVLGVIGIGYYFILLRAWFGSRIALIGAMLLALNPMHLYFSRTFQPDIPMLTAMTAGLYHLLRYLEGKRWHAVPLAFAIALAGCFKLSALFIGLPMLVLILVKRGGRGLLDPALWAAAILGLLPVVLWYAHARDLFLTSGYTVGILSGGHDKLQTLTYLSMPYWWHVMIVERFWDWILTPMGFPFAIAGLGIVAWWLRKPSEWNAKSSAVALLGWLSSGVLFILLVAEGNFDMPHYQLVVVPPLLAVVAIAINELLLRLPLRRTSKLLVLTLVGVCLAAGTFQALEHAYDVKRGPELALAEKVLDAGGEGGFLLVAGGYTTHKGGYDYEPMVFYYAHRRGWVLTPEGYSPQAIEHYYDQGARLLVSRKGEELEKVPGLADYLKNRHMVTSWGPEHWVVQLLPAPPPHTVFTSSPSPSTPAPLH